MNVIYSDFNSDLINDFDDLDLPEFDLDMCDGLRDDSKGEEAKEEKLLRWNARYYSTFFKILSRNKFSITFVRKIVEWKFQDPNQKQTLKKR